MPCPNCRDQGRDRKGDNMAVYDDGHGFCFVCNHHVQDVKGDSLSGTPSAGPAGTETLPEAPAPARLLKGQLLAERHRGISTDVLAKYDYRKAKANGVHYEVANYYRDGAVVGQKLRTAAKDFSTRGDMKHAPLFGQHLWRGGGNKIVVTEGEIDCMSVAELDRGKWPVVSVPSGAAGASRAFRDNLEFLDGYDEVVICFDQDEPGQKAAIECALILKPGKAKIAQLPRKDANEMVVAGEGVILKNCLWEAKPYRPDGIKHVSEVDTALVVEDVHDYPWPSMTKSLYGRSAGQLCMHTSGSGMGKTTVFREMQLYDLDQGLKVGAVMLEESTQDTLNSLIGLRLNLPIRKIMKAKAVNGRRVAKGLPPIDFGKLPDLDEEAYKAARAEFDKKPLYLYDHFGSLDSDILMQKLEYLAAGLRCDVIYLDHVSIVISGSESDNERKDIDILMTKLASFVERHRVRVEAISHLTKPQGSKPFEEGGQISLRDLRGSGALYQLAHEALAYERNQQNPDRETANTIMVRALKGRDVGFTGLCAALRYDEKTGRLKDIPWSFDDKGKLQFTGKSGYTELFENEDDQQEVSTVESSELIA